MTSHTVRFGSVALVLAPWRHGSGAMHWRASYYVGSVRHHLSGSTLARAKAKALEKAIELHRSTVDLNALPDSVLRQIRRLLDADPQLALVDEFLLWRSQTRPEKPAEEAVAEFLARKESNEGLSTQNVRTLRKHLAPLSSQFGGTSLAAITVAEVESYLVANPKNGNRTRRNIRGSLVTFFRWARSMGYLPEGPTVAEKAATPIVGYQLPTTYAPAELRIMLAAVRPEFLPWLALAAFAGIRTDEIAPIAGSRKSPLDWSDFEWERDLIIVRPETAKTKRRRIAPILPALRHWLYERRKERGPVHVGTAPTKRGRGADAVAETARLGALVGGWRPNALRHSFISYRAALVGIGQTAMEAGNSESQAKASYNSAKGADEAAEWFGIRAQKNPPC